MAREGWQQGCAWGSRCRGWLGLSPIRASLLPNLPCIPPWSHEPAWGPGTSTPACTVADVGKKPALPWQIPPLSANGLSPKRVFRAFRQWANSLLCPLQAGGRDTVALEHPWGTGILRHPPVPRVKRQGPLSKRDPDPDSKSSMQGNISAEELLLVYSKRATFFYAIFFF